MFTVITSENKMSLEQTACDGRLEGVREAPDGSHRMFAACYNEMENFTDSGVGMYSNCSISLVDGPAHASCLSHTVSLESPIFCLYFNFSSATIHDGCAQKGSGAEHHNGAHAVRAERLQHVLRRHRQAHPQAAPCQHLTHQCTYFIS